MTTKWDWSRVTEPRTERRAAERFWRSESRSGVSGPPNELYGARWVVRLLRSGTRSATRLQPQTEPPFVLFVASHRRKPVKMSPGCLIESEDS